MIGQERVECHEEAVVDHVADFAGESEEWGCILVVMFSHRRRCRRSCVRRVGHCSGLVAGFIYCGCW